MLRVRVILYGNLRNYAGWSSRDFLLSDDAKLSSLLELLKSESEKLRDIVTNVDNVIVLVNGKPVSQKELEKVILKDNDVVEILPSITGG